MRIKIKPNVPLKMGAIAQTPARVKIRARDLQSIVDEPVERGGSNLGFTPTETMLGALIGCTNVIANRLASEIGISLSEMEISLTADFNRLGAMLVEEIEQPFSNVIMNISVTSDGNVEQLEWLKESLAKYCPVAKVLRNSGINIQEIWSVTQI